MQYVGNNYTGGYHNAKAMVKNMRGLVDNDLLAHYVRLMKVDASTNFNAESSRENVILHCTQGTHPSITLNIEKVRNLRRSLDKYF